MCDDATPERGPVVRGQCIQQTIAAAVCGWVALVACGCTMIYASLYSFTDIWPYTARDEERFAIYMSGVLVGVVTPILLAICALQKYVQVRVHYRHTRPRGVCFRLRYIVRIT